MKTLSEYRAEARQALKGKWGTSALFVFVYAVVALIINGVTSIPVPGMEAITTGASLLGMLIILPLAYGMTVAFLGQLRGRELEVGQIFSGYNRRVWVTEIVKFLYIILWGIPAIIIAIVLFTGGAMAGMDLDTLMPIGIFVTLVAMIPMCIKTYAYSMVEYLLADNPELSNREALRESERITNGHKMRLFLLDLSFIGWTLLGILTLFIGLLWVGAYQYTARAAYYEDIKD